MSDEEFGLFGDMDISDIPDDPWFVGAGWYKATVTTSERRKKKDDSGWAWVINYTIDEPDSEYHGFNKSDWFNLYLTGGRTLKDLDKDEKAATIRMKVRIMEAFDRTEAEAGSFKPADAMGEDVYIQVVERAGKGEHEGKTFSNLQKVLSKRAFQEKNASADASMTEAGLSGM